MPLVLRTDAQRRELAADLVKWYCVVKRFLLIA